MIARAEEELKEKFLQEGRALNHSFYASQGRDARPHLDAALDALKAHGIAYDPREPSSSTAPDGADTRTDAALHLVKEANLAWDRVRNQENTVQGFDRILAMPRGMRRDVALAFYYVRTGGVARVIRKATQRRERRRR